MRLGHAVIGASVVVAAFLGAISCKTPAPIGAQTLEVSGDCSTLEAKVKSLQAELEQINAQVTKPATDGEAACKDKTGAQWNKDIGRCECITDPTKFTANAWSIRNTLKCEAAVDSFKACKEKAGATWNAEIGRCECVTDPTKFQGNAWSIRNTLKCQAATEAWTACKQVHGAIWNEEIGRCECESDPSKFQGNAFSIRNNLTCNDLKDIDADLKMDSLLNNQNIALADGFELTRDKEAVEKELADAVAALAACRSSATAGATSTQPTAAQNANCTASGGTVGADNVCKCADGTPVFKIGNTTCTEFAAQKSSGACIFIRTTAKQVQSTCVPDATQATCDKAYQVYYQNDKDIERRLVPGKNCLTAKNEAAAAITVTPTTTTPVNVEVTAQTGACMLKSKTSGREYCQTLTKARCDGWQSRNAKEYESGGFSAGGACAQTASTETSAVCTCGFSTGNRFCGVWKEGKLLTPYYGPLGAGWFCDSKSISNNICEYGAIKKVLGSDACR